MPDDAFPKIRINEIDFVDEDAVFAEGVMGLPGMAEAAHNMFVYQEAHKAEEEFPGFIHDHISVKGAHMCAIVDDMLWETINDPIVPSAEWLEQRVRETGGAC